MDCRTTDNDDAPSVAIVGAGRLGAALLKALLDAGIDAHGPFGRGYSGSPDPGSPDAGSTDAGSTDAGSATAGSPDAVLLCVPDAEIAAAARAIDHRNGLLVGHCSGASTLSSIGNHEAFSLHPLMTVPRSGARFTGATAAVAGSTDRALAFARSLAGALGMNAVHVTDDDRVAYHAAAAVASNQLLAVLELADQLATSVGLHREHLGSLVRATVANWVQAGATQALTGPVVRGDEQTIAGHLQAVRDRSAVNLPLYDELLAATRRLAAAQLAASTPLGGEATAEDRSGDNDHSTHTEHTNSGHAGGYVSEGDA